MEYTRRDFLRMGSVLAAGFGLGGQTAEVLAEGLTRIVERRKRVLWLHAQACTGCSISMLNTEEPDSLEVLTDLISLVFHPTISSAQGETALGAIRDIVKQREYLLVLEGSIPQGMPQACMLGREPISVLLPDIIRTADLVLAVGSCAAYGGVPAAEGNETGAVSVKAFMESKDLPVVNRLINCPGCPSHPQSIVGTLAYVAAQGYPEVHAERLTPNLFFRQSVHDNCPRFHCWQKGEFARTLGDEGCLFKLGCLGPLTHTDCPQRQWNGGVNWCIRSGAPCIACTSEQFSRQRSFPFYRIGELSHTVEYTENDRGGGSRHA